MSMMIEVMYKAPVDENRELRIKEIASRFGGRVTFHESPLNEHDVFSGVTLTIEFADQTAAQLACDTLTEAGEYVEGPVPYGDD